MESPGATMSRQRASSHGFVMRANGHPDLISLRSIRQARFWPIQGSEYHLWNLRLIRQQLAAINLDWEMPPHPPEGAALANRPLRIILQTNELVGPSRVAEQ